MLYNGVRPCPDQQVLKLADAFERLGGEIILPDLELKVKVYNINPGHNEGIVKGCEKLEGYSTFIARVREHQKTMPLEEAMKRAMEYCIKHNILSKFLLEHGSEVMNMLYTEWNWDDAKAVWQEEAREEILELINSGYTIEALKERLMGNKRAENEGETGS
ncbi:MAG: hypothetical protein LBK83_03045 [Treponema sp.]|nr:hypothetical protein [Treponema sp.]